ncbi:hypothetical protein [Leptothoe kymatousa]|uniref:Uncharacterized protein n=1 Tax=Leptothoe kymatousa TAU-MAC 1615 TaxID=2364775 RepID=A0ABS5Y6N2_9CYAN|nr:hypothetical protein [Leptothoe kymatousa]MBT9313472.1 hypothetical protein [Leptothoe kymatousa TAU-MAC 1615]
MNLIVSKPLEKAIALCFSLSLLAGCDADAPNHAIFRKTLNPLHQQIEIGMDKAELDTVVAAYPNLDTYEYSYDEFHSLDFDLEGETVEGLIVQLTMGGDPTNAGVQSVCFIKVLLRDNVAGDLQVTNVANVACPA